MLLRFLIIIAIAVLLGNLPDAARAQQWQDYQSIRHHFTKDEFQALLQDFVTDQYQKSFRHLGDIKDFHHGHIFYQYDGTSPGSRLAPESVFPFAILYHTQEAANYYSQKDPGGKYDYIDKAKRNWIQFFDPVTKKTQKIVLANAYAYSPSDLEAHKPISQNYTIHPDMLDPKKFSYGLDIQRQVEFTPTCANERSENFFLKPLYEIWIVLKGQDNPSCLMVTQLQAAIAQTINHLD
jgi:hypothetical protein